MLQTALWMKHNMHSSTYSSLCFLSNSSLSLSFFNLCIPLLLLFPGTPSLEVTVTRRICHAVPPTAGWHSVQVSTCVPMPAVFLHRTCALICSYICGPVCWRCVPLNMCQISLPRMLWGRSHVHVVCDQTLYLPAQCSMSVHCSHTCVSIYLSTTFVDSVYWKWNMTWLLLHTFLACIPPCSGYTNLTVAHCVAVYVYIYIWSKYLFYRTWWTVTELYIISSGQCVIMLWPGFWENKRLDQVTSTTIQYVTFLLSHAMLWPLEIVTMFFCWDATISLSTVFQHMAVLNVTMLQLIMSVLIIDFNQPRFYSDTKWIKICFYTSWEKKKKLDMLWKKKIILFFPSIFDHF